jgi:hypothetical protein
MNKKVIGYILTLTVLLMASVQLMYAHPTKRPIKGGSNRVKAVKVQNKTSAMTWRKAVKMLKNGTLRASYNTEEEFAVSKRYKCGCALGGGWSPYAHSIWCWGNYGGDCHTHQGSACLALCTLRTPC